MASKVRVRVSRGNGLELILDTHLCSLTLKVDENLGVELNDEGVGHTNGFLRLVTLALCEAGRSICLR